MRSKVWQGVLIHHQPSSASLRLCFLVEGATEYSAALELNRNYEKICFNAHHRSDWRRVYCFLRKTGNRCNLDHGGGDRQSLPDSVTSAQEENSCEKEEGCRGRGVSLAFRRIFSCAYTVESLQRR